MIDLLKTEYGKSFVFSYSFDFCSSWIFGQQIRFFFLQNRQGKTRLSKWYVVPPEDAEKFKLEADVNRVCANRSRGHTNFVEVNIPCAQIFCS